MKTASKHLLSLSVIVAFMLLAIGSKVNKIHMGAFATGNKVEDMSDIRNYILKMDGTKIYGDEIHWKSGILTKDQVSIDGEKYKLSDVRGYRSGNRYYIRFKKEFIERIIHGKINVYIQYTQVTTTSSSGRVSSYTRTDHYAQKGEEGELTGIAGQKDIKKLVEDCPESLERASVSNKEMRKAIKRDRNYLNSIFDIYNDNCKILIK
jgi:hypothetical protein